MRFVTRSSPSIHSSRSWGFHYRKCFKKEKTPTDIKSLQERDHPCKVSCQTRMAGILQVPPHEWNMSVRLLRWLKSGTCLHTWLNGAAGENYSSQNYCPNKIVSYFRARCHPGRFIAKTVAMGEHYCTDCPKPRKTKAGSLHLRQTRLENTFFSTSACLPVSLAQLPKAHYCTDILHVTFSSVKVLGVDWQASHIPHTLPQLITAGRQK